MPPARRAGRRLAALLVVLSAVFCTPGHSEAAEEGSDAAQQIRELYAAHNPDKLPSIAALLSKYAGRERELLCAVRQKYADGAAPPAQPPSARPGAHAAPAPPRAQREPAPPAAPPPTHIAPPLTCRLPGRAPARGVCRFDMPVP